MRTEVGLALGLVLAAMTNVASAQWTTNGSDAVYTMDLTQAINPDTKAVMMVSYQPRQGCRPQLSVLIISGSTLGTPTLQQESRGNADELQITVDGTSFQAPTKFTKYSNGIEFAVYAPAGLIAALASTKASVIAKIGQSKGGLDFSSGHGFAAANRVAKSRCS